jgi:hypothetical protein
MAEQLVNKLTIHAYISFIRSGKMPTFRHRLQELSQGGDYLLDESAIERISKIQSCTFLFCLPESKKQTLLGSKINNLCGIFGADVESNSRFTVNLLKYCCYLTEGLPQLVKLYR